MRSSRRRGSPHPRGSIRLRRIGPRPSSPQAPGMILLLLITTAAADLDYFRFKDTNGSLARTVILPRTTEAPFFDEPDNNYVLVSDSSMRSSPRSPVEEFVKKHPPRRNRRRRKNKRKVHAANITKPETQMQPRRSDKQAKFLNLFTIIQFPNDACGEEGGTCYHEFECNSLGGVATTRCARGYGVCCLIESTCGARTNINNTVFVGSETSLGSCSFSFDKIPCTRQIRLDFINFELDPPMDGECVKDRLFISGANRNVNVPVLCGSMTGQHIYLDVDEVPGPVVLNMIASRPNYRIKLSHVCDGSPILAPKNCLQYFTERTGTIRSFNYQPASLASSYLNNLNYAVCIAKDPEVCSIQYTNETPDGMEYEFDIVNLDEDGALSVPPRQAGAEVFNCPDDFIAISNIRLCGQKLNDGTVQVDFTKNYPVVDTTRGPFMLSVRTDESVVGRGFFLNYEQKPC